MAVTATSLIRVLGTINNGFAASYRYVTAQNIANLNTTGAVAPAAPLTGLEPVAYYGPSGGNIPSAEPFLTTTGSIQALGSVALSTLAGTEFVDIGAPVTGQSPSPVNRSTTTLKIAGI